MKFAVTPGLTRGLVLRSAGADMDSPLFGLLGPRLSLG
jgi:hypothetical protein